MKKLILLTAVAALCVQASAFKFNGKDIDENTNFARSSNGTTDKSLEEISGIACSRTTEGYFWVHVDQGDPKIYALDSKGAIKQTVTLKNPTKNNDWEDICMATVGGMNYILIGCIGDNDVKDGKSSGKQTYYIYRIREPEINGTNITINAGDVETITYTYDGTHNTDDCKDGKSHNAETLMFDPIKQKIYLATKHDTKINSLYETEWKAGSYTAVMNWVCDLGNLADMPKGYKKDPNDFLYLTAGDISSDGLKILIKNKYHTLCWERQGNEDLATTFTRSPQHIKAYQEESQGEAVAWANNNRDFYTASENGDAKKSQPLYFYKDNSPITSANETEIAPYSIRIADGLLMVDNLNNQRIEIYNTVGQKVIANTESPVNISALKGVYVVRIGAFARKVIF